MFGHTERLTRRELYDLVWSTPMVTLAQRYRLSGNGLAKLCARHDIAVPDRGYWQRREAGNAPKQPPLRPARHELLETVEIHVKSDPKEWLTDEQIVDFDQRIAAEGVAETRIVVEDVTLSLPLVVSTRRHLDSPATDAPHLDLRVSKDIRARALRVATAFVKACAKRGYLLQAPTSGENSKAVHAVICGETVAFHIFEPTKRVEHVLTAREQRERAAGRGWLIPNYDFVPTGKLQFLIDSYAGDEQRTFSDTAHVRLEDRLNEVVVGLLRTAMVLKARENYWAADRAAREQERRRRDEEEARMRAERQRRRELFRDALNLSRAQSLDRLIAAVEEGAASAPEYDLRLREWSDAARQMVESLHPVRRILRGLRT